MNVSNRAKEITQTLRDIIGHSFDGERVELYIYSELAKVVRDVIPDVMVPLSELREIEERFKNFVIAVRDIQTTANEVKCQRAFPCELLKQIDEVLPQ